MIKKVEKDYENFCAEWSQLEHFRIDCDKHPDIRFYYNMRVQPSITVQLNGMIVKTIIGYNFQFVGNYLEEMLKQEKDLYYIEGVDKVYNRPYDEHDMKAGQEQHDIDIMRLEIDDYKDPDRQPN